MPPYADRKRLFLVLEGVAEAAYQLAHLLARTPARSQGRLVDHERSRLVLSGELVRPRGGPLEPPVVVLQVSYLPGGFDGPVCYLNHSLSSMSFDPPNVQYTASSGRSKWTFEAVDARSRLEERALGLSRTSTESRALIVFCGVRPALLR